MKISEIMSPDVMCCRRDVSLSYVANMMGACHCGIIPILDEDQRVVGVVTDRDICLAVAERDKRASEVLAMEVASHVIFSCEVNDSVASVLRLMRKFSVRRMPVIDLHGALHGIVSIDDIIVADVDGLQKDAMETLRHIVSGQVHPVSSARGRCSESAEVKPDKDDGFISFG